MMDRDSKLVVLVAAGTPLGLGHAADHVLRDDPRWPSTAFFAIAIISLVLYGSIGGGLYSYAKGKVDPRFWAINTGRRQPACEGVRLVNSPSVSNYNCGRKCQGGVTDKRSDL